jgi:hypothetical protein
MNDKDKPTDTKHTVSLVNDLLHLLSMPPQVADDTEDRAYLIRASFDELVLRGFDRTDLLALAAHQTSIGMIAWIVIAAAMSEKLDFEVPAEWSALAQGVARLFSTQTISGPAIEELVSGLLAWNLKQNLDTLTSWKPMPPKDFITNNSPVRTFDRPALNRGLWIMDRFTRTYPHEWQTSSLDLEWKYIHGQEVGCASRDEMAQRRVSQADTAVVLADRAVKLRGNSKRTPRKFRAQDFTETAIELLSAGRYESAAAMYEALYKIDSTDPELANNLGFCLMPTDPERSLRLFEEAVRKTNNRMPVTWANQVAALYVLGRDAEALSVAEAGCDCPQDASGWLWLVDHTRRITGLGVNIGVTSYIYEIKGRLTAPHDAG